MKKIGLEVKEISGTRIKKYIKESESVFVVKYSGLSSPDICSLRQALRDVKVGMFVVKNTVARRALKDAGFEETSKKIEGPCGLVFIKEESAAASKVICNFAKDHEKLQVQGGFLNEKLLERKDIEALAKLPSKDVLRAQVVCTLKSPINNLVFVLNGTLKKFAVCLEQIKQKKAS
ncbi:MAG: 50S ribosomal protein L10 [Candidatus Omnitrophica bacterium]|jgi:large subunit ribosomal protein L10|nr:50S ribosomal protein L10 [Candidatus Omnitrophota bacterium]